MRALAELADIHYIRQGEPRGLGHAVGMARRHVGDEPFAVLLPDDLMAEDSDALARMIAAAERTRGVRGGASCGSAPEEIGKYGVVATDGRAATDGVVAHHHHGREARPRAPSRPTSPSSAATCSRPTCSTASPASGPAPSARSS